MPVVLRKKTTVQTYQQRVLATSPLAYWPLHETSGTQASDLSGNGYHGTYSAVTLGATGIGDGQTAASFNGTSSYVDVYSSGLASAFPSAAGSLMIWFADTPWTDGQFRRQITFGSADDSNRIGMLKSSSNGVVSQTRKAGGSDRSIFNGGNSSTGWLCALLTWSVSDNLLTAYKDGASVGTQTAPAWGAAALDSARCVIGAYTTSSQRWSGRLAHAAVWDYVLDATTIADLAVVT